MKKEFLKIEIKTKNPALARRIFSVDPAGIEPASLGTNASMLPNTPRARAHGAIIKQKWPLCEETISRYPALAHGEPYQRYTSHYTPIKINVNPYCE